MPTNRLPSVLQVVGTRSNSSREIEKELPTTGLIDRAARSLKWSTVAQILPRLASPVANLILAAVLVPTDFGLMAASMLVVSLAQNLVGLGTGQAVVQRHNNLHHVATTAFWINLIAGIVGYSAIWILAPVISSGFRMVQLQSVLQISGLSLLFFSVGAIPTALLQRALEFKKLLVVTSLPPVCSAVVSIYLAWMGNGVWALVWGQVSGSAFGALLVWVTARWVPTARIERQEARSLAKFAGWVMVANFETWLFLSADNAIAGYIFGARVLGLYTLGFNFASLLPGVVASAVAYPAFCALHDGVHEVGKSLVKLQSLVSLILFPLAFGLSAIGGSMIEIVYGSRWAGIEIVIAYLAIMPGTSHLWSLNADAYRAVGRPNVWPRLAALNLVIMLPLLFVAGQFGLLAFIVTRFAGAFILPMLNLVVSVRVLSISARAQLASFATPLVCSIVMFSLIHVLLGLMAPFEHSTDILKVCTIVGISGSAYLLLVRVLGRDSWQQLMYAIRTVLSA
jgi:lipopolysaccharide exporter